MLNKLVVKHLKLNIVTDSRKDLQITASHNHWWSCGDRVGDWSQETGRVPVPPVDDPPVRQGLRGPHTARSGSRRPSSLDES